VVATARQAFALTGASPPRRPWLDPLPAHLALADLPDGCVALVDDPDAQEQRPLGWCRDAGNLLCYGARGSGATTALLALAVAAVRTSSPFGLHLYAVDMGAGDLAPLAQLPHCGAVVTAADPERLGRLVRRLHDEVTARRDNGGQPEIVVVVDGLTAWRTAFDHPGAFELLDALDRVLLDGPALGIRVAATVDRPGAVPASITAGVRQRWVFALPDPADARALGVAPTGGFPRGRAIDAASGLELHVATPTLDDPAALAGGDPASFRAPVPIGVLPDIVAAATLPSVDTSTRPWSIPVGLRDDDLGAAVLTLHGGDHVLVTGRRRTGRSAALVLLVERLTAARRGLLVATVAPRPSPLACCPATLSLADGGGLAGLACLARESAPVLVVIDDAELVDDDGTLAAVLALRRDDLHVVAAGRPDVLRSAYGHWTTELRRSRLGVLLQPDVDVDGDLLGTVLPRRRPLARRPGRGYLVVDGQPQAVQLARPAIMDL
jgi:S-DNA-T family DNA segregation ATPase FtsK/SpoIIIE